MQTNKPEITKMYQSFYMICKGKIDEGTKPFSFSKRYGIPDTNNKLPIGANFNDRERP